MAAESVAVAPATAIPRQRVQSSVWLDYWALTKPEVNLLIVITTGAAFCMAEPRVSASLQLSLLLHTLIGTLLVASGAATLNQWMERRFDARMRRTARRPVAGGRVPAAHALMFGVLLSLAGICQLLLTVGTVPSLIALATLVSYLFLYTPLKRISPLCILIGAVPGAIPPLIGWTATGARLDHGAWLLWAIVFLWQFPHFMAIAWMYRDDYERAGYLVLPRGEARTRLVTWQTLLPLLGLILVTIPFGAAALLLDLAFLYLGLRFVLQRSAGTARRLLLASIVYLPALLTLGVVFRFLR
jgi:protoheme IX farnesyltransferase